MHFAFDDHQLEFRAQLRAFAEKSAPRPTLREAWASALGWSRPRWEALAEMGVVGLTVPEVHGGLGLDLVDLVLLLEEAGRSGLPEPLVETAALGVPLLADAPGAQGDALRARWLAAVADGGAAIAVGMSSMPAVPGAEGADLLLLEGDGELHAVPAAAVVLTPRPVARRGAPVGRGLVGAVPGDPAGLGFRSRRRPRRIEDRAAMGTGAVFVGWPTG